MRAHSTKEDLRGAEKERTLKKFIQLSFLLTDAILVLIAKISFMRKFDLRENCGKTFLSHDLFSLEPFENFR